MWQRWNSSTHIFEKSDNDGASWTPLGLSGAIITDGTVADARLSSNVALLNAANVFTANQRVNKTRPEWQMLHSGSAIGRLLSPTAGEASLGANISHDGTNWNLDDTGVAGAVLRIAPNGDVTYSVASAGSNPRTLTELLRLDWTGNSGRIAIPAGVKFPATQVASTDVNTLDDYEEGTWTPVIGGDGGQSGQSYASQLGSYTKKGREVTINFFATLTAKGTITGTVQIHGLPFGSESTYYAPGACSFWNNMGASFVHVGIYLAPGASSAYLTGITAAAAACIANRTTSDITDNTGLMGSFTYRATA